MAETVNNSAQVKLMRCAEHSTPKAIIYFQKLEIQDYFVFLKTYMSILLPLLQIDCPYMLIFQIEMSRFQRSYLDKYWAIIQRKTISIYSTTTIIQSQEKY